MPKKSQSKTGRWIAFLLTLGVMGGLFLMAIRTLLPEKEVTHIAGYEPWPEEVLKEAARLPVHDGGRVKPLETFASYSMLRMYGKRSMYVKGEEDGERITVHSMEWLLDAVFRPQLAIKMPTFRIDNSDVLALIGLEGKEKRDRYSYLELVEARDRLMELKELYLAKQKRQEKLEPDQSQTLDLANNVDAYELLLGYFTFAREAVELKGAAESGVPQYQRVSTLMSMAGVISNVIKESKAANQPLPAHVRDILEQVTTLSNLSRAGLVLFPPTNTDPDARWMAAGNRIFTVMTGECADPEEALEDIKRLEVLYAASAGETKEFVSELRELRESTEGRARKRGEDASLVWEERLNAGQWFFIALFFCFVPAVLFLTLSWLQPKGIWGTVMTVLVWIFTSSGLVLLVIGTVLRSIVMQRPPVGNLYDTMPFIALVAVAVAMITEAITKRRIAIGMAPIIGLAGLTLARLYEFGEGTDTMDPLIAVLRSNFWLTIHVLTITMGYAAGLLAAGLGAVYVFKRVFGLYNPETEKSERRGLTRMTYGTLGFTLLLSLVGTVLGGVWANYSWGRFWGWDPKENGALMIVLWTLFILHGRIGGYLREWGINLCAIFGAAIVTFSWWHVNLLGVGLHSYGFSDSKKTAVMIAYGIVGVVLLIGMGYALWEKEQNKQKRGKEAQAPAGEPEMP